MLSQTTGYAITALGHLADCGNHPCLIKDIAEATGLPHAYLAKIINSLARKGLILTQRGIGGGAELAKSARQISLYDVALALDEPLLQEKCMFGTSHCSDERACPAHEFWKVQREKQITFLKTHSLEDIAEFERRRKPLQPLAYTGSG